MKWISKDIPSKIKMILHGISSCYLFELSDKYFQISYPIDISITNMYQGYPWEIFILFCHGQPWEPCCPFRPGSARPSSLRCAAPQSHPPTDPPDEVCPAQTATALPPPLPLPLSTPHPFEIFVRPISIPGSARPCCAGHPRAAPRARYISCVCF